MGGGSYSTTTRALRSTSMGYDTKSVKEIFKAKAINNAMNPYGVRIREARDSSEHPNSLAIVLALDLTGSMGSVPHFLVREGLPSIVDRIIKSGIPDPQILFLGVGDHECDQAPLQVGQFESSDLMLDHWLTDVFLEGGGGGNYGESYSLAWYFAGYHTDIDCFEKRKQKGFLFTIGDEPVLQEIPAKAVKKLMGDGQYEDYTAHKLLEKASEKYHVFHIHVKETGAGSRKETIDGWKQLMRDNLIIAERHQDIAQLIADTVIKNIPAGEKQQVSAAAAAEATKPEEMML